MAETVMEEPAAAGAAAGSPFFAVRNLSRRFGALTAVDGLSFEVRRGEILGIAGPNGAGKSTLLNLCSGFLAPDAGSIIFEGQRVDGLPPFAMCHRGVVRTFQIPQVFGSLSVEENVEIGAIFGDAQGAGRAADGPDAVEAILASVGLTARRQAPAATVDLLTRKTTMLAAALATRPKIVFMDEPFAGLSIDETGIFVNLIARLHEETDIAFVIVEHKIRALAQLSDRLMVIHFGRCICLDTPERVVRDAQVIEVYLGAQFVA